MAHAEQFTIQDYPDHTQEAYQGVGEELRFARIQAGFELADVAERLRIRDSHLAALEEGRFGDLPGPAYVTGFLRSYANFLGLSGEAVLQSYREEVSRTPSAQDLHFPEPPSDGWMPRAAILSVSLILAGAVFGGWYYLQTRDRVDVDQVNDPPSGLTVTEATGGAEVMVADAALDTEPEEQGSAADVTETGLHGADKSFGDAGAMRDPMAAEASVVEDLDLVRFAATSSAPGEGPAEDAAAVAAPEPAAAAGWGPQRDAAADPVGDAEAPAEPAAGAGDTEAVVAAADPTALDPNPDDGYEPRVYSEGQATGRVVVRATADSWVQVQGRNDELLMTRILHPGDTYVVPDGRDDLTLITGNAGGLEILVDGQPTPSLGPDGAVRRNIVLTPEALNGG